MSGMPRQVKTILHLFLLTLVLGAVYLIMHAATPDPQNATAKVSMLNIGQGDSFLIQAANGTQLLIDGGRDDKVLTELADVMPPGDRSIDVVIATHPDADHIGGLPLVLERYHVGLFLTSEVFTDTKAFTTLYEKLEAHKIPSYFARHGMKLALDTIHPASFTILFPDRDTSVWETNNASIVGRLDIGKRSALFTGDSPISIEQFLASADPEDLDVDILKLGHHGSKTSTSEAYLKATTPSIALISAGVNNRYGHPHQEVLDRLKSFGIPWISTQDKGTVTFETDGTKWHLLRE